MEATNAAPLPYASPGRRLLAAFIDNFVVSFVAIPLTGDSSRKFAEAVFEGGDLAAGDRARLLVVTVLVIVVYCTAMHAWRGATFGKIAARVQLVNDDGSPVSVPGAFVRAVAQASIFFVSAAALSFPMLLDMLWPIGHRRRQTWHDMIARTVVVRADASRAGTTRPSDG